MTAIQRFNNNFYDLQTHTIMIHLNLSILPYEHPEYLSVNTLS